MHVFDLHVSKGQCIRAAPWFQRIRLAEAVLAECQSIKIVPVAISSAEKQALWQRIQRDHGEGVVFKRLDCHVSTGRPNTGGNWLKFKFTTSASCCVMDVNAGRRSVKIGLLDSRPDVIQGQTMIPVGNVTIPPNHAVPVAGDIVEVEYLYAYRGGSLYQPVYRGKRMDLDRSACNMGQLKYKPEGCKDDAA